MKVTFSATHSVFAVKAPKDTLVSLSETPTQVEDGVYKIGDNGVVLIDEQYQTDSIYLSTAGQDYTVAKGERIATVAEGVEVWAGSSGVSCPFVKSGKGGGGSSGGCNYKGTTTTAIENGSTTNPITIDGESYTAVFGDIVVYGYTEFVFDGTTWSEFGRPFDTTPTSGSANAVTSDGIKTALDAKQNAMQYTTMPTITASMLGKVVQYVGATDSTYTQGYFYIASSDGAAEPTYYWQPVDKPAYTLTTLWEYDGVDHIDTVGTVICSEAELAEYDFVGLLYGYRNMTSGEVTGQYSFAPTTAMPRILISDATFATAANNCYNGRIGINDGNLKITAVANNTYDEQGIKFRMGIYRVVAVKFGVSDAALAQSGYSETVLYAINAQGSNTFSVPIATLQQYDMIGISVGFYEAGTDPSGFVAECWGYLPASRIQGAVPADKSLFEICEGLQKALVNRFTLGTDSNGNFVLKNVQTDLNPSQYPCVVFRCIGIKY